MITSHIFICLNVLAPLCGAVPTTADQQFEQLAAQYVDQFPALSPVSATQLGDHRFDSELNELTERARNKSLTFHRDFLKRVNAIDARQLARANQVDHALLEHELRAHIRLCIPFITLSPEECFSILSRGQSNPPLN